MLAKSVDLFRGIQIKFKWAVENKSKDNEVTSPQQSHLKKKFYRRLISNVNNFFLSFRKIINTKCYGYLK